MNYIYDARAKQLILEVGHDLHLFPYNLSSPYIIDRNSRLIINTKSGLKLHVDLLCNKDFLINKLKVDVKVIDWNARKQMLKKIPKHVII